MKVALVSRATAGYLRALHESFAEAMGSQDKLEILWPDDVVRQASISGHLPSAPNLTIHTVSAPQGSPWIARWLSVSRQEPVMPRLPTGAVWRQLRQSKPDLVWIHEYSPFTLEALLFAKLHALPLVVSSEMGQSNACYFGRIVRAWHRFWGHLADGFIACCPSARQPLCASAAPVIEAYHAVDSRIFMPAPERTSDSSVTFVYVGSLIERKGIDLLFAAAAQLRSQCTQPFRLRLIGSGEDIEIRAHAASLGLEAVVEFTGRLQGSTLLDGIRSADVFVLPTRQDTYGAVVHEAACLGLPLLVSQHAGAAEALVIEGVTGYTINPSDAPSFADRMHQLMDPDLRINLAASARTRGEELSAHRRATALWTWMQNEFLIPNKSYPSPALA